MIMLSVVVERIIVLTLLEVALVVELISVEYSF